MPPAPRHVLYVELNAENAVETLRSLLLHFARQEGFEGGELLTSPAQSGLALVQARWSGEPPPVQVAGARAWSFVVVERALPLSAADVE